MIRKKDLNFKKSKANQQIYNNNNILKLEKEKWSPPTFEFTWNEETKYIDNLIKEILVFKREK